MENNFEAQNKPQKFGFSGILQLSFAGLAILLVVIALLIPAVSVTYKVSGSSTTTSFYLFDLIGSTINVSSGSISATGGSFYGFLTICIMLIAPILFLSNKKEVKAISLTVVLASLCLSIYFYISAKSATKSLEDSTNYSVAFSGIIVLLVSQILAFIGTLVAFILYIFKIDEKISKLSKGSSLEEKLQENMKLLNSGLITQKEYDDRRKAILEGKE